MSIGSLNERLGRFCHFAGVSADAFEIIPSPISARVRQPPTGGAVIALLTRENRATLVVPRQGLPSHNAFLLGEIETPPRREGAAESSEVAFSDHPFWGPLRGLRTRWRLSARVRGQLHFEEADGWVPLLHVGGAIWFACREGQQGCLFAWAGPHLPDLDEVVPGISQPADDAHNERLLMLLPFLGFCRHVFGERMWHPQQHYANLIIDDPGLQERHGFFSPRKLLSALRDLPFAVTIAFIPWNWNRTSQSASAFFVEQANHLSLCIHGCDHTGNEFGTGTFSDLLSISYLALSRCSAMFRTTGVNVADVMVFPQGRFSKNAVAAIREAGYLAAANTSRFPKDAERGEVRLADLMQPAFTRFSSFPILARRYPHDTVLCAIDLFLGRPLLAVEHHQYFDDGYRRCRDWFASINGLKDTRIEWRSLGNVAERVCRMRRLDDENIEVRFYTHRFLLEPFPYGSPTLHFRTAIQETDLIESVACNGAAVEFRIVDGEIRFEHPASSERELAIKIERRRAAPGRVVYQPLSLRLWIWLRHWLCDYRDNHPLVFRFLGFGRRVFRNGD